jgi:cytochrome P450
MSSLHAPLSSPTDTADLPLYPFARTPGCPFDPAPQVREPGQEPQKVRIWNGTTAWMFSKHEHVMSLFSDPRVSHDTTRPNYPHESAGFEQKAKQGQAFVVMDDPEHARQRRMANPAFTAKRIMAMREPIQAEIDRHIDRLLAGPKPVDLVENFALAVPSLIISMMLGVPEEEQERFQYAAGLSIAQTTPPEVVLETTGALLKYLEELVIEKMNNPQDDLLSDIATKNVATGQLTSREAAVMARLLLIGGHETTANMIALSVALLLQHPDQLDELRTTDDETLMPRAIEELLRFHTIAHFGQRRMAIEDIEIGGVTVKAGEGIILAIEGANRSPEVYPDPDTFDIHREMPGHLAFGWGPHGCIGQSLARLELKIALTTLFRRIPTLHLAAEIDDLTFKDDAMIYGVHTLPVSW